MSINGDEDKRAWLQEIESVEPLEPSPTIPRIRQRKDSGRNPVTRHGESENTGFSSTCLMRRREANPMIDITPPSGSAKYARSGLQKKTIDKLKQGQPLFEARLDLHGYNRAEANEELEQFFMSSIQSGFRCVLVIHGKGHHSPDKAVLKTFTMDWLKGIDAVQAFCTAKQDDGGTGALYVLLKRQVQ